MIVTDPNGDETVHYFDSGSSIFSRWQYGLPFRRCDAEQDPPGTYLSQEIYDGDRNGTLLRSIYVNYDSDGRDSGSQQEKNHRLRIRRVEYDDDPGRFKQIVFSDFDGLGHHRETVVTGNFDDDLVYVRQIGSSGGIGQERFFNYDNRGFLAWEEHPEVAGTVSYTYDASGNALSKVISGSADHSLFSTYDSANRLVLLQENSDDGLRPLKQFYYSRSNRDGGVDKSAGKLVLSKRHNWVDLVGPIEGVGILPAVISQATKYEGLDGRPSARQTRYNLFGAHHVFQTMFEYDQIGKISGIEYPSCPYFPCAPNVPERQVDFDYVRGFLSAVPGFADSIDYQLGGMLFRVDHSNDVTETIDRPPYRFQRPDRIHTSGVAGGLDWDTGDYEYDGAGNVKEIGGRFFRYDKTSRLISGAIDDGGVTRTQSVAYDSWGNVTQITTDGSTLNTATSVETNRLTAAGASYDAGGNLTDVTLGGVSYHYDYDALNMMKHLQSDDGEARVYLYDADDERIISVDCPSGDCDGESRRWNVTPRGLDGMVLRELVREEPGLFEWRRDTVYRDGSLLAAVEDHPGGDRTLHFHLDHLGSPRQVTTGSGIELSRHTYYPFGGEATDAAQDEVPFKFTGHERDDNGSTGPGKLDYMHARYCSPLTGRFLSVDPVVGRAKTPQSWNRYSYTINNPLKYVDPDGRSIWTSLIRVIRHAPTGTRRVIDHISANSKQTAMKRTRRALDRIDHRQRSQGARRVVETETDEARDAVARQLSSNKEMRPLEKSGGPGSPYPEHVHPKEGPYRDVHVQTKTTLVTLITASGLGEILAPTTSEIIESGEATAGELISAAAWDVTSTLDPIFATDAINWYFEIE